MRAWIVRQPKLAAPDRKAMFALHRRYFDGCRRERFLQDMAQKDWVIVLRDERGAIAGYSTVQVLRVPPRGTAQDGKSSRREAGSTADGAPVEPGLSRLQSGLSRHDCSCAASSAPAPVFLFSGDTVVDRAHWRNPALAGAFGHMMLRAIHDAALSRVYWFLITKGYRTYRFLPVYFHEFHPACDRDPPPEYPALLRAVARRKFGDDFDDPSGIVRHAGGGDCLRPAFCGVPKGRERDAHVEFFLRRNPEYRRGDELACLAEVSEANLNRLAWRVIRGTEVTWDE